MDGLVEDHRVHHILVEALSHDQRSYGTAGARLVGHRREIRAEHEKDSHDLALKEFIPQEIVRAQIRHIDQGLHERLN